MRAFDQDAFVEMKQRVRALGGGGIVRHHQDGLVIFGGEAREQIENFVGAFAVEIAGRLVAEQKRGIGDDGASDGHALLLPAGKLTRIMVHAIGETDDRKRGLDVLAPLGP